jgi:8-oxo-dGTP diphosphatase
VGVRCQTDGVALREWLVAGAVIESADGLLMVRNVRRGGVTDWSTPGGVIDADDPSVLHGLAREVEEETGLRVSSWEGPLYEVHAVAIDLGWTMRCEVYVAVAFEGELRVEDPDGIVVEAVFVPIAEIGARLEGCMQWVRDPLHEWIAERWSPSSPRRFHFEVRGTRLGELEVSRAAAS